VVDNVVVKRPLHYPIKLKKQEKGENFNIYV
jgi:hypothetical protein